MIRISLFGSPTIELFPDSIWSVSRPDRRVSVFKIDPGTGDRLGLLTTAIVGETGWVDLLAPIIVRAGEAFVVVPETSLG